MSEMLQKYADLLVNYSLELQPGDRCYVRSTTLAEPLLRELYRAGLRAGAHLVFDLDFREQQRIFYQEANGAQLDWVDPAYQNAIENYEAYLYVRAPYNLADGQDADPAKRQQRQQATRAVGKIYSERTATRALRRSLCQYPTAAAAQNAGMSLEAYEQFIFGACKLHEENPRSAWLAVRAQQQHIVDHLNGCTQVRYRNGDTDIEFSTRGRTWINSDGQTNMPSGEVYTSPVEDSVNGTVRFNYPAVYMGHEVEDVTLWVQHGYIERWEARRGGEFLDRIFELEGTRRFGEAAIGTNYDIDRFTKNILFDEKIGGTIHMAIGQSYLQAGGKNQSSVHWDMIADMTNGGEILADGERIYADGKFLL